MKIDKITNKINSKINEDILPVEFKISNSIYESFINKISKTDFANTERRYIIELEQLKQLKNVAKKYNIQNETDKIQEKITKITEKLKNEFGITFNN